MVISKGNSSICDTFQVYLYFHRSKNIRFSWVLHKIGKLISGGVDDAPGTPYWVDDDPGFLSSLDIGVKGDSGWSTVLGILVTACEGLIHAANV
jgi:hypothetical protein